MARSGGPTVGLDIGSNMIKVAEVVSGRNGVTVRALGMAPTPPGCMENNIIVDAQMLGQAVKKLLRESGISVKSSVSSVSGQSALVVRVIEVPKMSESELAEAMKWEVERQVPFAADQVIMDFQAINRPDDPPDAQNMDVLLAVAQQDMIDRHVEMLFASGLSPSAIDVEPLAASRALVELRPDAWAQRTSVIVNIGASNTDVGIFRNGVLSFPRNLPIAGDSLTAAIAQQMGLTPEQAEETKRTYGEVILDQMSQPQQAPTDAGFMDFSVPGAIAPEPAAQPGRMPFDFTQPEEEAAAQQAAPTFDLGEPSQPAQANMPVPVVQHDPTKLEVFAAMAPLLGDLLTELRRSLEYYQSRSTSGVVDEILLCGGSSKLKGLDKLFEADLGIPTRVASPFEYAQVAAKNYSPDHLNEIAPFFTLAVGLAARDMVSQPAMPAASGGKRGKK